MSLQSNLLQLEALVNNVEVLTLKMQSHIENANTASAASAATYLLTSGSKSKTIKTIGQVGAIAGFLYSSNQRNKANNIEGIVIQYIGSGIAIIESDCISAVRVERDVTLIRKFLELTLRLGRSFDPIIEKNVSKVLYMGFLGESNQNILKNLNRYEVFNMKLRFNRMIENIDRNNRLDYIENNYITSINQINSSKLIREGLYMRIIILGLVVSGIFASQHSEKGIYLAIGGVALWVLNHFFPFGSESVKLRKAVKAFCSELRSTMAIRQITLR